MLSRAHQVVRTSVIVVTVIVCIATVTAAPGLAQQAHAPDALSAADYEHAEGFLGANLDSLVLRSGVSPNWLPGERFWYRIAIADGNEFILGDPENGTREPAFDHARLAEALSEASGEAFEAYGLPFARFELDADMIRFNAAGRGWACNI
ncbi:MAG: hypothetical protein IH849_05180, partial [Acidobacteria bacterium]|nr:hypothetical protein [Acidobacteriota bacterium]